MASVILSLSLALTNAQLLRSQSDYAAPIMAGISNHGQNQGQPYVTAGDRAYLIGTQDGNFPDMGDHVPGEMGGLWLHPIKLIDGFWATVTDLATRQQVALSESAEFINYPYGNRFRYGPVLDSLEIERFQFSPDGQQGLIVQYSFSNASARKRQLQLSVVGQDGSPSGLVFGAASASRTLRTPSPGSPTSRLFVARDTGHPWFCVWGASRSADAQPVAAPTADRTRSGMGVTAASRYSAVGRAHGTATLTFVIAGSATDKDAAVDTYAYLARNHASAPGERRRRTTPRSSNGRRSRFPTGACRRSTTG